MICQINFSACESNLCCPLHEVLNIEASSIEVNDIYQSICQKLLEVHFESPRIRSYERYNLFLKELKNRNIKFSKVESRALIF